ncbi:Cys-tRNA(Pro) deacylase [Olsenella porci]|jgi:Cys-tRNA(Pro)/Cys-tRNA(Cys) deacylase|uniref:Cys-tRNA(Pro)/Cys-tRNA(Cys) deacylase n=1 Tax=Olsenella porci TaxID=2652279 RepID=A0A6N7XMV0_9ACTN|nr:Cys-tRNA(Pro) deacylase [Olsenella porci]MST72568.1 Cys-tRNA(Pro) deacylase [Olsenella porci]
MTKRDKVQKTNAMRELERGGVSYEWHEMEEDDLSRGLGLRMAEEAGEDPDSSFKTLVTVAPSGDHVVCCIPVAQELDFKKAAAAAGEKSLSLIPVKELEGLTGYVRGGCTPVGMKKAFPTLIDETAQLFDTIIISGGRRGLSLTLDPVALRDFLGATFADITR